MALTPITTRRLNTLEPTTFPRAISLLPFKAAVTLTASSGALVPKATMVSPIIREGILRRLAIEEAPSTNKSAPLTSNKNPRIRKNTDAIISKNPPIKIFCIC